MTRDGLPNDFFDRLSPKKEALLRVLLAAEGDWVEGSRLRQLMREDHGLSVPDESGAIASHQGHLTKRYSKRLSRDVINVRWVDESRGIAEYRLGTTYEDEIRDHFER